MGLRIRKSINIGKHFKVNLSKSGVGFSAGVKGFRVTRTANGKYRKTITVPGTGISYEKGYFCLAYGLCLRGGEAAS